MEILNPSQIEQFLLWSLAFIEVGLGLYILFLNYWHTSNRYMGAYMLLLAINTAAVGFAITAYTVAQVRLPTYLLSAVVLATSPAQFLLTVSLLTPDWFKRLRVLWWLVAGLIFLPGVLTVIDIVAGTKLFYTGIEPGSYAGGVPVLADYLNGSLGSPIRILNFSVLSLVALSPMLYILFRDIFIHDKKITPTSRQLAWVLLIPWVFTFAIQFGFRGFLPNQITTFLTSLVATVAYAYASFRQMVSERRSQRGNLQTRLTVLIFVITLPILVAITAIITTGAGTLLHKDATERLKDTNLSLTGTIQTWVDLNGRVLLQLAALPDIVSMDPLRQQPVLDATAKAYPYMYLISTTDLKGMNIARNDRKTLTDYSDRSWFQNVRDGAPLAYQSLIGKTSNLPALVIAVPIKRDDGQIVGVVMFASELTNFFEEVNARKIDTTGIAFLVNNQNKVIAHPDKAYQQLNDFSAYPPVAALRRGAIGSVTFTDDQGVDWQAYVNVMDNDWGVVIQQRESEIAAQVNPIRNLSLVIGSIGVVILLIFSWLTVRQALRPILALTDTAVAISGGELNRVAPVESNDEFGLLAQTFNRMTERLRGLIAGLEERVAERTQALEKRAVQLQAATEVARDATTLNELDPLLSRSVNLIHDRFGFYHVGIFLPDDQKRFAILRAATGEAGRSMLQNNFKLKIGDAGIISYAFVNGISRVVNDVTTDFSYIKHPLLPNTRAEATLPFKAGDTVIGILDVQSAEINAFEAEEVAILQLLADQLAVAIQNTRLLTDLQASLREANLLYQRFTQQAWSKLTLSNRLSGYEYDLARVTPIQHALPLDVIAELQAGKAIATHQTDHGQNRSVLVSPLAMFGQVIGVIGLENENPDHKWTDDEINIVESVTSQVALAIDNARLLEETQFRTEQIRLLQEITASAASQVNLQDLLNEVTPKIMRGFNAQRCMVIMFDPDRKNATLLTDAISEAEAVQNSLVGQRLSLDNEFLQMIFYSHQAGVLYDVQNNPITAGLRTLLSSRGTHSLAFAPLILRGEVIGAIELEIADPMRQINDDEIHLMDQISLQTAAAIDVARSIEKTIRQADKNRRITEVSAHIRETLDVETILRTTANEVRQALGVPEVIVRLTSTSDTSGPRPPERRVEDLL